MERQETAYGYLEREGVVAGPYSRDEARERVAASPDADWRYSPQGVRFDALPDWAREAPASDEHSPPIPLPVARVWPDNDAWHRRVVTGGALAILIGLLIPDVRLQGDSADWIPLWDLPGLAGWSTYSVFALASLLVFGTVLPLFGLRDPDTGRRALRLAWVSGFALFAYLISSQPGAAPGDLLFEGLLGPERTSRLAESDALDLPSGLDFRLLILLAGCALVAAGTHIEARYLARATPLLARSGGWLVIAAFVLPTWDTTLGTIAWIDPIVGGDDYREQSFSFVALGALVLGIFATLAGTRATDSRAGCQVRRLLTYAIALAAPLVAYASLAAHYAHGPGPAVGVLRDALVAYGLLAVFAGSAAAWGVAALPYQPTGAGAVPRMRELNARQRTVALCLLLLAIAPQVTLRMEGGQIIEEAQWLFERVWATLGGQFDGLTYLLPGQRVAVAIAQLLPLLLAVLLYAAGRRESRRGAAALGLVVLAIAVVPVGMRTGPVGVGHAPLSAAIVEAWSAGPSSVTRADGLGAQNLGLVSSAAVALVAAALLRARHRQGALGWAQAASIGGWTTLALGLVLPMGGAVSGYYLLRSCWREQMWPLGLAGVALVALAAAAVCVARSETRARALGRLVVPVLAACVVLLNASTYLVFLDTPSPTLDRLAWLWFGRLLLELALMTVLLIAWLYEALGWFSVDPTLRTQEVFE